MHSQQLLYLIEISNCCSMKKASQNLHLTSQALCMSMKKLENELGIKLLKTTALGTVLTEEGEQLVAFSKSFFENIETLKPQQAVLSESLTFACLPGIFSKFLPKLYDYIAQNAVNYKITNSISDSLHNLLPRLKNGELPYFFAYVPKHDTKQIIDYDDTLIFTPAIKLNSYVFVRDAHPLTKYNTVSLKTVFKYPMVGIDGTEYYWAYYKKQLGIMPPSFYHFSTFLPIQSFLLNSDSVFMSDSHDLAKDGLTAIKIRDIYSEFGYFYNQDYPLSVQEQKHLDFLLEFFKSQFDKTD